MGKNFNKTIKHFLSGGIIGIDKDVVDLMSIALEVIGKKTFKGVLICELGNQKMRFGKYKTGKNPSKKELAELPHVSSFLDKQDVGDAFNIILSMK